MIGKRKVGGPERDRNLEEGVAQLSDDGAALVGVVIAGQEETLVGARRRGHIHRQQLEVVLALQVREEVGFERLCTIDSCMRMQSGTATLEFDFAGL